MPFTDAIQVLRDIYQHSLGIYPHLNPNGKRPLASVALHEMEDISDTSCLAQAIHAFVAKNVNKYTGLSLKDFLSLPSDWIEMIYKEVDKAARAESSENSGALQQLQNMANENRR